ncbi:MAG TPA: sulfotransferase [Actinomycetota bacterium]|nr:sulfotransferase [Actinomycetota bacterium]
MVDVTVRLPTFVIIGAAKAGTTALYWYLAEHPQVFMSPMKETNFFAFGLDERGDPLYGDPELHRFPIRSLAEYRALFVDADDALAIGEASPVYLECPDAASRIHEHLPEARIVCILREPVDRAYSDYQMYLRSRGRQLVAERDLTPAAAWAQPDSHWMRIGRYHQALRRYYDRFPAERIEVLLFDDLRRDAPATVAAVYRAIGVDPAFVPRFDVPHNVGGVPSNMALERVLTSSTIRRILEPVVPRRAADLARRLRTRNLTKAPPLPPEMRERMSRSFADDVRATSELIGRDLGPWLPRS